MINSLAPVPAAAALSHIETLAKAYAAQRTIVADRVDSLEKDIRALQRLRLPGIKSAVAAAADAQAKLTAAIEAQPELFVRPRTVTLHGIKVGFQKGKGTVEWPEDAQLIVQIKKCFAPVTVRTLIDTIEKPNKEAILKLPLHELKKLGVSVSGTGDFVFVKASDSEVDKLVTKILKEGSIAEAE